MICQSRTYSFRYASGKGHDESLRAVSAIYRSSAHSFSRRICSSSSGVKSFVMLNVWSFVSMAGVHGGRERTL